MRTIEEFRETAEPTFEALQELANMSAESGSEFSIKLGLNRDNPDEFKFKIIQGGEKNIGLFLSMMIPPKTDQCLDSHTHYHAEDEVNPFAQIFLSGSDLYGVFAPTGNSAEGSLFVPSQKGITFVMNIAKCGKTDGSGAYYWTQLKGNETIHLGLEQDFIHSFTNESEPMQFNAYWVRLNYVADILFVPYEDLAKFTEETGENLTDITHGEGLPKLAKYFSPDFAEQNPPKNLYELAVKRKEIFGLGQD